jgi:hypothetical protein
MLYDRDAAVVIANADEGCARAHPSLMMIGSVCSAGADRPKPHARSSLAQEGSLMTSYKHRLRRKRAKLASRKKKEKEKARSKAPRGRR